MSYDKKRLIGIITNVGEHIVGQVPDNVVPVEPAKYPEFSLAIFELDHLHLLNVRAVANIQGQNNPQPKLYLPLIDPVDDEDNVQVIKVDAIVRCYEPKTKLTKEYFHAEDQTRAARSGIVTPASMPPTPVNAPR